MTWTKQSVTATADTGKVKIGGSGIDVRKPVRDTGTLSRAKAGTPEIQVPATETTDTGKVKIGGSGIDLRKPRR